MSSSRIRERLPNRRASEVFDFEVGGLTYTASFARFADGKISKVFLNNHKCDRADELARQQHVSAETLRIRRLLSDDISLERAWYEINNPRNRPTPQITIEAVIHSVRERCVAALDEPANIERLRRCDVRALTLINQRIAKLKDDSHA
jgi:hypothetical protein